MFNKQYTLYNYSFSYMKICKINKKKKPRILSFLVVCLFPSRPSIILFIDTYASFSILYNYQVFLQVCFFCFLFGFTKLSKGLLLGGGGGGEGSQILPFKVQSCMECKIWKTSRLWWIKKSVDKVDHMLGKNLISRGYCS